MHLRFNYIQYTLTVIYYTYQYFELHDNFKLLYFLKFTILNLIAFLKIEYYTIC